jgi:PIN domain nuclease of toxin-antitoxin system
VKLLFDTHAFIWWDGDQSKLSAEALAACQSTENSLHLSLASVWELQIKMQLGKLALRLPLADVLRDQQQQNGLVLEPVTLEDILALSALPALHRDPFDRLIIAQANQGGFHLITHDPELARSASAGLRLCLLWACDPTPTSRRSKSSRSGSTRRKKFGE